MTNWTRSHDAWIARECEGLEVEWRIAGVGQSGMADWCFRSPMPFIPHGGEPEDVWVPVKCYLTDPAAAIRAAEAWRKKGKLRIARLSMHSRGCSSRLYDGLNWLDEGPHTNPAAALAQALYRATGGPE